MPRHLPQTVDKRRTRNRVAISIAAAVVLVVGLSVGGLLVRASHSRGVGSDRQSAAARLDTIVGAQRLCLIAAPNTGPLADVSTATYDGMRRAAAAQKANAVRFNATGAIGAQGAPPPAGYIESASTSALTELLNAALGEQCTVLVTVGATDGAIADSVAKSHPHQLFLLIGAQAHQKNETTVALAAPSIVESEATGSLEHLMGVARTPTTPTGTH